MEDNFFSLLLCLSNRWEGERKGAKEGGEKRKNEGWKEREGGKKEEGGRE